MHLYDAGDPYQGEADEVGGAIRDVHLGMCHELEPDPEELVGRLRGVVGQAESVSCLDSPDDYAPLLGDELAATLQPTDQPTA